MDATRARHPWAWGWADRFPDDAARAQLAQLATALLGRALPGEAPPGSQRRRRDLPAPRQPRRPPRSPIAAPGRRPRATLAPRQGLPRPGPRLRRRLRRRARLDAGPRDEAEVGAVLDWCAGAGAAPSRSAAARASSAASSRAHARARGGSPLDLGRLDRVLEVDAVSRAARIQAGARGPEPRRRSSPATASPSATSRSRTSSRPSAAGSPPAPAATTRPSTPTSTIWCESVRMVTPRGLSRRAALPASGAGPAPSGCVLGSEGASASSPRRGCASSAAAAVARLGQRQVRPLRGRRRRRRARVAQAGLLPVQLPPARRRRGHAPSGLDRRHSRARSSASSPPTTRSARGSPARSSSRATPAARSRRRRPRPTPTAGAARGRGRRVAPGLPRCALPAERAGLARRARRHLRDRVHLGSLPRAPRGRQRRRSTRAPCARVRRRHRRVPLHPRLSRRPRAVLHVRRPRGRARRRARPVARDQGCGLRGARRRRRHHHAPPRGRPRPPALVRPRAPELFADALRAVKRELDPARSSTRACSSAEASGASRPPYRRGRRSSAGKPINAEPVIRSRALRRAERADLRTGAAAVPRRASRSTQSP